MLRLCLQTLVEMISHCVFVREEEVGPIGTSETIIKKKETVQFSYT